MGRRNHHWIVKGSLAGPQRPLSGEGRGGDNGRGGERERHGRGIVTMGIGKPCDFLAIDIGYIGGGFG